MCEKPNKRFQQQAEARIYRTTIVDIAAAAAAQKATTTAATATLRPSNNNSSKAKPAERIAQKSIFALVKNISSKLQGICANG